MAKEWANKDKYHLSNGVLEPHVQMPRAKASVRTVRAWGERKAVGGSCAPLLSIRFCFRFSLQPVRGRSELQ
jgi:hypothetical protein